jgi:excisionase family DNA binding protein
MHAHLAFTPAEAAAALRVRNSRLRTLIKSGKLPAFRVGPQRGIRISVRAVHAFMEKEIFNAPLVDTCGHESQTDTTHTTP